MFLIKCNKLKEQGYIGKKDSELNSRNKIMTMYQEVSPKHNNKYYLVKRIAHNKVIRLFIRGSTMSDGSFGKAKKPSVACQFPK